MKVDDSAAGHVSVERKEDLAIAVAILVTTVVDFCELLNPAENTDTFNSALFAIHAAGWALTELGELSPHADVEKLGIACSRLLDRHKARADGAIFAQEKEGRQ